ncbi:MAG: TonB family protein [Acidobacteriaceae bacterium]|nr:TonB family protein [Acidobacteriaceae bacterium]
MNRNVLAKTSGNVTLSFMVDTQGSPSDVQVVQADHSDLGPCAIDMVRSSLFHPATRNGKNVSMRMEMPVYVSGKQN